MNVFSSPNDVRSLIRLSAEPDFSLGDLQVRPSLREVAGHAQTEQLEPRVMQVLVALARAGGAVVSRDALIQCCWEGRIVGEAAINRCISKLRELAEAGGERSFTIETIPRVGYRLLSASRVARIEEATTAVPKATEAKSPRGKFPLLAAVLAGIVAIALSLAIYEFRNRPEISPRGALPPHAQPASIAVLPFKNLSSDKDAGYLAAGVQDEILTRLAKIGSLRVISRTSVEQFADRPPNIPEIAKRLGVANVLEGNVQRVGDAVRINVQLIRAASDDHLWAEDYDRKLNDVLSVESDVADAIAAALAAKMTPAERRAITARPTTSSQAYNLYLRALVFAHKNDGESPRTAVQLFQQAVNADPKFALAWAWLARMQAFVHFGDDLTAARHGAGHAALMKALELEPDLVEVQAAKGYYLYYGERNYPAAQREFERVNARWPNNAEALEALGLILRRQGKWRESADAFIGLVRFDPLVPEHREILAETLMTLRNYTGALRVLDNALQIWPDNSSILAEKAAMYQLTGQLDQADPILKNLHPRPDELNVISAVVTQFWLRRQYTRGAAYARGLLGLDEQENPGGSSMWLHIMIGEFLRMSGDKNGARENYSRALDYILTNLKTRPHDENLLTTLPIVYAGLGDFRGAMAACDRARLTFRSANDALDGPAVEDTRAHVMARFGNRAEAIAEIERVLEMRGRDTPATLRVDPDFDRLRGDPRFEKLAHSDVRMND